jgi:hypothetical protein
MLGRLSLRLTYSVPTEITFFLIVIGSYATSGTIIN